MYKFFAYLDRMKFINRWGLMRNVRIENVAEHSHQVSVIAYTLALIDKQIFGVEINPDRVMVVASFHEAGEVVTGDLPTPVKYFNDDINQAYKRIENIAENKLLSMLPEELKETLKRDIQPDKNSYEYRIVKAADKISAYIKCVEEMNSGNTEFESAKKYMKQTIEEFNLRCVDYFMENFVTAYFMNLDELL